MKFRMLLALGICLCVGSWAQTPVTAPDATDTNEERQRIQVKREVIKAEFLKEQQDCAARFAVSDCVTQARRKHRARLDDLRRQEVVINDLERQRKAATQLDRIHNNQSPQRQQELELQRQQALKADLERQTRSEDKKAAQSRPAAVASTATRTVKPIMSASEVQNQEKRYNDKLLEAQQRKADKARSLLNKGSGTEKSLPQPSDL